MSPGRVQVVGLPARLALVLKALVEVLAKKSCRWAAPGLPGNTVGSSELVCEDPHTTWKAPKVPRAATVADSDVVPAEPTAIPAAASAAARAAAKGGDVLPHVCFPSTHPGLC